MNIFNRILDRTRGFYLFIVIEKIHTRARARAKWQNGLLNQASGDHVNTLRVEDAITSSY